MKAAVVLAALAVVAYCQTPPTISPSFSATTVGVFYNRTHAGTEHVDAQNQRTASVQKFANNDIADAVTFTANHSSFHFGIFNGTAHCEVERDPRPFFNVWEWVAQSKSAGACTADTKSGQAWSVSGPEGTLTLCAADNIPLQVEFKGQDGHVEVTTYTSFVAGVPPVSDFTVPDHCRPHGQ